MRALKFYECLRTWTEFASNAKTFRCVTQKLNKQELLCWDHLNCGFNRLFAWLWSRDQLSVITETIHFCKDLLAQAVVQAEIAY